MSHREHKHQAPETVKCAVITISDTRDEEKDYSGKKIKQMLTEEDHEVISYKIVRDEVESIIEVLRSVDVEVYLLNGGTGISGRDVTPDALEEEIDEEIPGFAEIFRVLSYRDIGPAAMLSRAKAGISGTRIYFALPGSMSAVELAMEELILPELGHLVYEVNKE